MYITDSWESDLYLELSLENNVDLMLIYRHKDYGAVKTNKLTITHQMQQQCWPKECFQC